ncbi:MAG: tetratricopeptide repeat protein [Candidatus Lokiarchaeota archaeon]|nr:tetratricopeptide repeat protein [Candidatus Lokiarchaeota archaeon]
MLTFLNNEESLSKGEIEDLIKEKRENLKELENFGKNSAYIKELSGLAFLQLEIELFEESEKNFQVCLKHFKKQLDRLGQASVYGVLGILFFKRGNYEKSISHYERAYEIYKELNQIQEEITSLKCIGNSLFKLNNLDDACDKFLECSAICSDNNDIHNLLDCLGSLIQIHEKQEKFDVVFELYKKSLHAFKELNDAQGIIISYFNLGILKNKSKEAEEALRYFKKGTNVAIDSNFTELILKGLSYIGENLFYQGKIKESKNEFIKALGLAKKVNAKNAILQLKILLNSIGLNEKDIERELTERRRNKN